MKESARLVRMGFLAVEDAAANAACNLRSTVVAESAEREKEIRGVIVHNLLMIGSPGTANDARTPAGYLMPSLTALEKPGNHPNLQCHGPIAGRRLASDDASFPLTQPYDNASQKVLSRQVFPSLGVTSIPRTG